jgi:cation diffusion facilitator family transporter
MAPSTSPSPDRAARVRRVLAVILVANLAVLGVRLLIGIVSGSMAILGGALDAAVDTLNNVLALTVVRVASKEPDEDHPYGHGKFETLGALAIVGFLSITCFELVRGSVNQLFAGPPSPLRGPVTDLQLAVLAGTLGVNGLVAWTERRAGTALGSELLLVDAAHTRADVLITVGVLGGVLFARQGVWWVDPAVAIGVAVAIIRIAYRIVVRTVPVLVDQQAVPTSSIQETARAVAGVKSAYGIRSRGPIDLRYAEVTIAVDRNANVEAAHVIADQVEERLKRDLQLHEVTVHIEPC